MSAEREAAINKIKKLLRLTKSSNEHESAAALRQATSLMRKHGLDRDDVDDESSRSVWRTPYGGIANPHPTLIGIIHAVHRAFNTRDLLGQYVRGAGTKQPQVCIEVHFFGAGATARLATYAAQFMLRSLERDRSNALRGMMKEIVRRVPVGPFGDFRLVRDYRPISRKERNALSVTFDRNWIAAAWQNLLDIAIDEEATAVAIRRRDEATGGNVLEVAPKKADALRSAAVEAAARDAGSKFRIHRPVESEARGPLGIGHDR